MIRTQRRVVLIEIRRRENESPLDYHKRIVYGKLVDKTLADLDYTEIAELLYGRPYASDVARRMLYGSRHTLELMDEERRCGISDSDIATETDAKLFEIKKERQKLFDQRMAFNKLIRDRSRQEELNEILTEAIRSGDLPAFEYKKRDVTYADNDLLISLNDIHYGASHENFWGKYDSDICVEMMRGYLDRVIDIAETHHSENCIIWQNGDAISGNIHRSIQVTNKENVIEQVIGVSEIISSFIAELSKHFKTVQYVSVSGNHSRIEPNKENALVEERLDDLVEWYLKARLQNLENVVIGAGDRIDATMYTIDIRGLTYVGVHGDMDGTEGKVQALQTMVGRPVYAVLSGHKHHNKVDEVQGIKSVMAGSFLGIDPFCVQKRIFGRPEQMVCVCDKYGIRCHYDVPLTY